MLAGGRNPKERTLLGLAILWATILTIGLAQCAGGDRAGASTLDDETLFHSQENAS